MVGGLVAVTSAVVLLWLTNPPLEQDLVRYLTTESPAVSPTPTPSPSPTPSVTLPPRLGPPSTAGQAAPSTGAGPAERALPLDSAAAVRDPTTAPCTGGSLAVVAHPDDDLLFMNPTQQRDVTAGTCLYTLYLTAGDAGKPPSHWQNRERGVVAAYAHMAGVPDETLEGQLTGSITSRGIRVVTLRGDPRVHLVFLRLPDGLPRGGGSPANRSVSLMKLWTGAVGSVTAVDGSNTYTRAQLLQILTELMRLTAPQSVRTLDYLGGYQDRDHTDHHSAAYLTRQASSDYPAAHTLTSYQGYPMALKPPNLPPEEAEAKREAFAIYAGHDPTRNNPAYLAREYVVARSP